MACSAVSRDYRSPPYRALLEKNPYRSKLTVNVIVNERAFIVYTRYTLMKVYRAPYLLHFDA